MAYSNPSSAEIMSYTDVLALDREQGITHGDVLIKWQSLSPIPLERLKVVKFSYFDFEGNRHDDGEVVVLDAVAPRVKKILALMQNEWVTAN